MKPAAQIARGMEEYLGLKPSAIHSFENFYGRVLRVLRGKKEVPIEWEEALMAATESKTLAELQENLPQIRLRHDAFSDPINSFLAILSFSKQKIQLKAEDFVKLLHAQDILNGLGLIMEIKIIPFVS